MATTIQTIETPKHARALDTSSGWQEVGLELITDGGFTDEQSGGANWSTGTGWTDTGGFGDWDTDAVGGNDRLYQDIPTLVVGKYYKLVFTISNSTSGRQLVRLLGGDALQDVTYANAGTTFAAGGITYVDDVTAKGYGTYVNGTHTLIFAATQASDQFNFYANDTYSDFRVDDISLKEVRHFPNNNHGQIYSGRALEFDGVADYLSVAADSRFILGNNDHTLTGWFNTSDLGSSVYNYVVAIGNNANNEMSSIGIYSDGKLFVSKYASAVTTTNSHININTWYRVTMVYNGSTDTADFYLNGKFIESKSITLGVTTGKLTIGVHTGLSINYTGMISDVQVWDKAWTAEDVEYDYLNPESLALNRDGTSLTNSNLLAWYPMQDGHRGQQSCVLDASNVGLGDELITNGSFTGITQAVDTTGSEWTTRAGWTISEGKAHRDGSGGSNSDIEQSISVVDGTTYKFSYTRTYASGSGQTNIYIRTNNVDYVTVGSYTSTTVEEHTVTGYFTALFTGSMPFRVFGIGTWTGTFDNISVKPVNDKNPATTVFYGDNLYTAANALKVAADGTTADDTDATTGWSTAATSSHTTSSTVHTGNKSMTYTANANNGRVYTDLQSYMTVGRTYKLSIFARHVGSGADQYLRFSSATDMTSDAINLTNGVFTSSDTTFEEAHLTFVYDDSNYRYFGAREIDGDAGTGSGGLFMDTMYIKEVGTASGWTDADQQLHIPQTTLQPYNELLWMQGQEVNGAETDNVPITIGSDVWNPASNNVPNDGKTALDWNTISAWVFFTEDSFNDTAFLWRVEGGDPNLYAVPSTDNVKIGLNTGAGEVVGATYPQSALLNKWNHIVFAWKPISHIELYGGDVNEMAFGTINGSGVSTGTATAVIADSDANGSTDLTEITLDSIPGAMTKLSRLKYMQGTTRPATAGGANVNCAIITYINTATDTITLNDGVAFTNGQTITVDLYDADNLDSHVRLWINGEKLPVTQVSNYHSNNVATSAQHNLEIGDSTVNTAAYSHQGIITEISAWNKDLSTSEVEELYNDGKPLDALTHSALTNLKGYWRNNGLNTWKDLVQSNNGTPSSTCSETILIPQGVDSSRDSQGFIMNRQRNTSSLNLARNNDTADYTGSGMEARYTRDGVVDSQFGDGLGDFSIEFWFKTNQILSSSGSVLYQSASYSAPNWSGLDISLSYAGKIQATFYTNGGTPSSVLWGDSDEGTSADENYNDGNWHHVAFVVDRSTEATLIIDKIVESVYTSNVTSHTSAPCFNGSQRVGSSTSAFQTGATTNRPAFDGQIDGLKIYNDLLTFDTDGSIAEGETVTSGQVLRNYNATKGSHRN